MTPEGLNELVAAGERIALIVVLVWLAGMAVFLWAGSRKR